MALQIKHWRIEPPVPGEHLARFPDLPPLVVQLLYNRKILDPDQVRSFLAEPGPGHNPFQLKGMSEAVGRIRAAIRRGEPVAIYGDFDTDGVTATALLVQALSALGANVRPYIPDRVDEGYGLNLGALRTLYRAGIRLVVTADCGIRSVKEVSRASRGLDFVITDHHSVGPDLPPAVAIVNPKQEGCPYPFKDLAGVGLAFKLAQALLLAGKQDRKPAATLTEEDLVDLVALGTVADLAPLVSENRALVRRGLVRLNQPSRPGVEALMAEAQVRRGDVDATAIGFRLAPRLNAAGRIDKAMLAYKLLTSRDPLETKELAGKLGKLNQLRQQLTAQTVAEAEAQVQAADPDAYLYLAASQSFQPGIVGLAASRLTEVYYRPSVVVELGANKSRGSCRSIPEFNITQALEECRDLLDRFGGHAAAAGFTVPTPNLEELRQCLQAIAADQLSGVDLRPTLPIDAQLPLETVDWSTQALLSQLEPCGIANPQPVLLSPGVAVQDSRPIGNEGQHLKLALRDERGLAWDAVFFRARPSYRPSFRSRWYISLAGAVICLFLMFQMDPLYALLAIVVMAFLYWGIQRSMDHEDDLGAIFQGVMTQLTRRLQIRLQKAPPDEWRPSIITVTDRTFDRSAPMLMLTWLSHRYGFGTYLHYIEGFLTDENYRQSQVVHERLLEIQEQRPSGVFVDTMISPSMRSALAQTLQAPGIAGVENNTVLFEFSVHDSMEVVDEVRDGVLLAQTTRMDSLVLRHGDHHFGNRASIHIWLTWHDYRNASLMILLSYILLGHPDWADAELSIFAAFPESQVKERTAELMALIEEGRIAISGRKVKVFPTDDRIDFSRLVEAKSADADLVLMGFTEQRLRAKGSALLMRHPKLNEILWVSARESIAIE